MLKFTGCKKNQTIRQLPHRRTTALAVILLAILAPICHRSAQAIELSDVPLFSRVMAPPANIMVLFDDSGSMTFEILVKGVSEGRYPVEGGSACFVFDDIGDNLYPQSTMGSWYLGQEGRRYWQSQYYGVNALYYNPATAYEPWPSSSNPGQTMPPADPNYPRTHPVLYSNVTPVDLDAKSFEAPDIDNGSRQQILYTVCHAHYFDRVDDTVYLVELKGSGGSGEIKYYRVRLEGSGLAQRVSGLDPIDAAEVPDALVTGRSYDSERQNFANWYTYHRRREFAAKNALARVIAGLRAVRVGIYGINEKIVVPLKAVGVEGQTDQTSAILKTLYEARNSYSGGTPLRGGLYKVGSFFKNNDGKIGSVSTGVKPYGTDMADACQQSYTVIVTDGYYSDDTYDPVGNVDGIDPKPGDGVADKWGRGSAPYADSYPRGTMADIAMYFYATDLSAALEDKVPTNSYDRASHQHMLTYAVAFGVTGTLTPENYERNRLAGDNYLREITGVNAATGGYVYGDPVAWPQVHDDRIPETIDDLWHASVNGRGDFVSAGDPDELNAALEQVMSTIQELSIGSSSSVTVNGDWLFGKAGYSSYLYQATYSFRSGEWYGDLKAYQFNPATGELAEPDSGSHWVSAAEELESQDWDRQRRMATYNPAAGQGVPFRADRLTGEQLSALGSAPADMVAYLRGRELGGVYRLRSRKLGDIVHSSPVFESDVIYVGANDGMLHAFNAETGREIFAYVPNLLFTHNDLTALADVAYDHRFYVDLTPTVKKARGLLVDNAVGTLLVGGLRKGGKGYFALDVTDADAIASESELAARVLWEFPAAVDNDLGYTYSKPIVVKSNSSLHPWVVIFGNGYDSVNEKSVLYVVNARTGVLVKRIPAGSDPANGLSSPIGIDVNSDAKVDFVYAGDLQGNLWKFDLHVTDTSDWQVAYGSASVPRPLFQALDSAGNPQPITSKPDVMYHPEKHGFMVCFGTGRYLSEADFTNPGNQTIYGIWDFGDTVYARTAFGGLRWSDDDNSEYLGVFDRDAASQLSRLNQNIGLLQNQFTDVDLDLDGSGDTETTVRLVWSDEDIAWQTQADTTGQMPNPSESLPNHAGYYLDLAEGERVISDVLIRNRILIAIGFQPSDDPCLPGGRSMLMELDAFTGGAPGGRLNLAQFDVTGNLRIDEGDLLNFGSDDRPEWWVPTGILLTGNLQPPAIMRLNDAVEVKYMSSSTGRIERVVERAARLGVAYWMEINQ
jgi:type IV pilus assembly protein PilY1